MLADLTDFYLPKPNIQIESAEGQVQSIKYTHASMQGWRKTMEDAILIEPNLAKNVHCFGVFDGHGGSEVAAIVASKFPSFLKKSKFFAEKNYEKALEDTFIKLDKWLISDEGVKELLQLKFQEPWDTILSQTKGKKSTKKSKLGQELQQFEEFKNKYSPEEILKFVGINLAEESGSTANIILIDEKKIYCANLGDSRSVCIQNKKFVSMSFDHKPDDRNEKKRIQKANGFVMDGRVCGSLSLSRAFGDFQFKGEEEDEYMVSSHPEIRVFDRESIEMIIIACDGIWEGYEDYGQLVAKCVQKDIQGGLNGLKILTKLFGSILAKELTEQTIWGLDNMSCILLQFQKVGIPGIKKKIKKNK